MTTQPFEQTRTAYLLDVDNLCGSGRASEMAVRDTISRFERRFQPGPDDFVSCAAVPMTAFHVKRFRPQYLVRAGVGRDGADRRLLELADPEFLAQRVGRVVIGSGDGIFSTLAKDLRSKGLPVEVFARTGSLAHTLATAATFVQTYHQLAPMERAA